MSSRSPKNDISYLVLLWSAEDEGRKRFTVSEDIVVKAKVTYATQFVEMHKKQEVSSAQ